jgi:Uma2 family endonuclease
MAVTAETYRRVALEDPDGHWELHQGRLREKPSMTYRHNYAVVYLGHQLLNQLDPRDFQVRINIGHVRRTNSTYYIPDVFVIPTSLIGPDSDRPDVLEIYDDPLPLVVEVRSPSTGNYDVDEKIPEYRRRGDLEIWRLHPFERTLTVWRRQPDGSYTESLFRGGTVQPVTLPNVTIDLDALFA